MRCLSDAPREQARQRDGGSGRYEEGLLLYLTVNNIAEDNADRRKAICYEVGKDIYQLLPDLCSPEKPAI